MIERPLIIGSSAQSIPAKAGIGLRAVHHDALVRDQPAVAWLEAHSENYFADGGAPIDYLMRLRAMYPLSLHGVGLSIGSTDPLDQEHLRKLKRLISRAEPAMVSEHLCWGSVGGRHMNDLLPMPYTTEALKHMVQRVCDVQDFLGRRILIENVSSYLQFKGSHLQESEFLAALAQEADCMLLLDVNNVYVSARNHGFDAREFIRGIPPQRVQELHLAGHTVNEHGDREVVIDTHAGPVCDAVWQLYDFTLQHCGAVPTLIEWDTDIPALDVLVAEAHKATLHLEHVHGLAA